MPLRWPAGNSHILFEYDCSVRSMGSAVTLLERAMEAVAENSQLLLDEEYAMGIFAELERKLPPLAEYHRYYIIEQGDGARRLLRLRTSICTRARQALLAAARGQPLDHEHLHLARSRRG
eukprot:4835483-Pleurochrysis_carterae.AAC.5